ncbi:hypothetical protein ACFOND_03495 [Reinekea marina]|uniref:PilZ domain-containing protein n=1 Tax=Reinekea marina TaxID=1310421 RepID=A0ABV7WRN4_9GAMM
MLARKFRRISLDANILVINNQGKEAMCRCLEFSNDGIDLEPIQLNLTHMNDLFHAGQIVDLQIQDVTDAPVIKAAIIRASINFASLRFIPQV